MATAIETLSHNIGHATVVIPGVEPPAPTSPTFPNGIVSTGRITCTLMIDFSENNSSIFFCNFQVPDNRRSRARFMRVSPDASIFYVNNLLKHWCDGVSDHVLANLLKMICMTMFRLHRWLFLSRVVQKRSP